MIRAAIIMVCCSLVLLGCTQVVDTEQTQQVEEIKTAILAGGCFWCSEQALEQVPGVIEVVSGFTGGEGPAEYYAVASGQTDHREAVQVTYDPTQTSYEVLLDAYWKHINPTDAQGQFADRGFQYSPAIFYMTEEEKRLAEASRDAINSSGVFEGEVTVLILPAKEFYVAEEYHQDYYKKNPTRYGIYKRLSGREGFIEENWK